ncbi:hypothetical protein FRC03_011183 [Tulasnella sp. 419]|nr:hypothetical protein FRC03_011183 [Tulasnella sp. 419]
MSYAIVQGCSKGLGRAVTRALLNNSKLHVIGTTSSGSRQAQSSILEGLNSDVKSRLTTIDMDVRDEGAIKHASQEVQERFGNKLRLLLNISGVLHAEKNVGSVSYDKALESFQINTIGHLMVYKYFVPLLPRQKDMQKTAEGGKDLNEDAASGLLQEGRSVVASVTARVGSIGENKKGGWYSYRSSKAATNQIIKCLAHEMTMRTFPAVVIAYHPGTVKTGLSAPYVSNESTKEGLFEADEAADRMMKVLRGVKDEQNGAFLDYNGQSVSW